MICGKPAFAYRIELDDSRTYLCVKHFPEGDVEDQPGEGDANACGDQGSPQEPWT